SGVTKFVAMSTSRNVTSAVIAMVASMNPRGCRLAEGGPCLHAALRWYPGDQRMVEMHGRSGAGRDAERDLLRERGHIAHRIDTGHGGLAPLAHLQEVRV